MSELRFRGVSVCFSLYRREEVESGFVVLFFGVYSFFIVVSKREWLMFCLRYGIIVF